MNQPRVSDAMKSAALARYIELEPGSEDWQDKDDPVTLEFLGELIAAALAAQAPPPVVGDAVVRLNYIAHMKGIGGVEPPAWWRDAFNAGYSTHAAEQEAHPAPAGLSGEVVAWTNRPSLERMARVGYVEMWRDTRHDRTVPLYLHSERES